MPNPKGSSAMTGSRSATQSETEVSDRFSSPCHLFCIEILSIRMRKRLVFCIFPRLFSPPRMDVSFLSRPID